ncbi:MAG: bifunctional anthranilate synthase component I family protein/class IV aminotransferase [Solirubrobacterales bacterium]|nr:bifunctional anthranilate synthase component I family protein/class IV aminotransferase [Solirubrobacterales bacterium]
MTVAVRPFRVALESEASPVQAVRLLRGEHRPFALMGEWLGGLAVLGSAPARVASAAEDPFAVLDSDSAPTPAGGEDSVRVGGGWVGWLGYGLGGIVEELPPSPPAPIPRPAFSLAFYDHVLVHDGEGWWFEALWSAERDAVLRERIEAWRARLATLSVVADEPDRTGAMSHPFVLSANGAAGHVEAVADCRRRIEAGELYEANLCVRLEARFDGDPVDLFARAVPAASPRFGALIDGVISLSPERFLRRVGREVWTEPIKGTRPRVGADAAQAAAQRELAGSEKDAAEHVMIVDLMRNDLGRVCRYGSVRAEPPRVEAHAGVWHLVSTVSGTLREGVGDGELLRASFPPGSVTGAPKVQAIKVIAALEATRREVYTGAIGIASPFAGLDLSVAIRTFEVSGDAIWLGAGGAVVADSDPERELAEAFDKAAGPIAALGGTLVRETVPRAGAGSEPARALPPPALAFGDRPDPALGVFETVLIEHGRPVGLEHHLARLAASVALLYGGALPSTLSAGVQAAAAQAADAPRARLRVLADPSGNVRVTVAPAGLLRAEPIALMPFTLPGGLGAHKWRDRRLVEALAAASPGAVPLLVDTDGCVLEAAHANVWVVEAEALVTPPADGRILPGTAREALLTADPVAREEPVDLSRLARADAVFLTSSISGRHPARLLADGVPTCKPAGQEVHT